MLQDKCITEDKSRTQSHRDTPPAHLYEIGGLKMSYDAATKQKRKGGEIFMDSTIPIYYSTGRAGRQMGKQATWSRWRQDRRFGIGLTGHPDTLFLVDTGQERCPNHEENDQRNDTQPARPRQLPNDSEH